MVLCYGGHRELTQDCSNPLIKFLHFTDDKKKIFSKYKMFSHSWSCSVIIATLCSRSYCSRGGNESDTTICLLISHWALAQQANSSSHQFSLPVSQRGPITCPHHTADEKSSKTEIFVSTHFCSGQNPLIVGSLRDRSTTCSFQPAYCFGPVRSAFKHADGFKGNNLHLVLSKGISLRCS